MSHIKQLNHLKIPLQDIKNATQDFDERNLIGCGGYGRVYKGNLFRSHSESQSEPVAVKRLDVMGLQGNKEFYTEVAMLSQYRHENIIALIGFCDDNNEMILVYEYASHGSLDTYLSNDTNLSALSWLKRLKICVGVACALDYLHNHVALDHRVIHRDIKSANILLDQYWNAKVSDFGLSKIGLANQANTFLITNIAGTYGYCDPQYEKTGILTKESDVYSFGVVLFEILCGRLVCVAKYHDERRFLHHLVRHHYKNGELDKIIDHRIRKHITPRTLTKFSALAYQCLQETREKRPTMAEVVPELKKAREIQIIQLTEDLDILSEGDSEVMDRAENALHLAMSRLEDEFRHILICNTVPFDADRLYGSVHTASLPNDGEIEDVLESFGEEDQGGSSYYHERGASLGGDVRVDLIRNDAVWELKEIADRMIRLGYENECCQVYMSVRRDVLDECVSILGLERLSIEEVQKIEWRILDKKMKKWIQAVKIVVRVLLFGEKRLCEHVFSESELIKEICFVETTKGCVMQLLNFGEPFAIGQRSPEKLFRILDMYDVLADVLPDLETLFTDESGERVCSEAKGVLNGLGVAGIGTFVEFENAVKGDNSSRAIQGGEIHPLTRYVMNYMKLLVDYSDSLNTLLPNNEDHDHGSSPLDNGDSVDTLSPIARRLLSLITSLESNLEKKSRLYDDNAMQYIFLMNNILYIVKKVKDTELQNLLGDQWIRKRRGQIRQWHISYLRTSWGKALLCLKDKGIGGSSSSASMVILKEKSKSFNACFEDIYRIQSAWKVPDAQLREELRISISEKVLLAYRVFVERFGSRLESGRHAGKYIKYSPDDLENYLSDLFEGTAAVLNHMKRKST